MGELRSRRVVPMPSQVNLHFHVSESMSEERMRDIYGHNRPTWKLNENNEPRALIHPPSVHTRPKRTTAPRRTIQHTIINVSFDYTTPPRYRLINTSRERIMPDTSLCSCDFFLMIWFPCLMCSRFSIHFLALQRFVMISGVSVGVISFD